MQIKAQVAMVMNLDKCLGCHTCSLTCKNVWTNRPGAEYMWFNDVESKPGVGYPKEWEDQKRWRGGWELDRKGNPRLRSGVKAKKLANIFFNPDLPLIDDYYEPWTYDYDTLTTSPRSKHQPVARPISQLTGEPLELKWGPNWEDGLAGGPETGPKDPNLRGELEESVRMEYEQVFMMYLPRICGHCLNTTCMASCLSGAIYKREEDGIILIDQEKCRGWRMCVSGCPYKKVYFNWRTGKAEKCTLCYPRIEAGQPTVCAETCVGRIRYLGPILYDADRIKETAATPRERDLLAAQMDLFLDPSDPQVQAQARRDGIQEDWLEAACRSPVYALIAKHRVALPLHPEFRTLPMVWYVPPLSPVTSMIEGTGSAADPDDVFPAIDQLRIPIKYLANMLTAGDEDAVRRVLKRLAAMRSYMREVNLAGEDNPAIAGKGEPATAGEGDPAIAGSVDMAPGELEEMYRLLAVAKYEDRFVVPKAHTELAGNVHDQQGSCGLDFARGQEGPLGGGGGEQ